MTKSNTKKERPTIGLLMDWASSSYQVKVWSGVAELARERNVNLINFVSGALSSVHSGGREHSKFFRLINTDNIDGLIILPSSIAHSIGSDAITSFLDKFQTLPLVSIAMKLDGIPSIVTDNKNGMRDLLEHLIDIHGYEHYAFIKGPEEHTDAKERYQVFLNVLKERNITIDEELIVEGDFTMFAGQAAVKGLMSRRKTDFDVIIAANDQMAIGAMSVLSERGVKIPEEIAVVGFDDIELHRTISPPLTTVRQPLQREGRRAAEQLLSLIDGEHVELVEVLKTDLILRESCGCFYKSGTIKHTINEVTGRDDRYIPIWLQHESVVAEIIKTISHHFSHYSEFYQELICEKIEQLLHALYEDLKKRRKDNFLFLWNDTLCQAIQTGPRIQVWRSALSAFFIACLHRIYDQNSRKFAEELFKQARAMIIETEKRTKDYKMLKTARESLSARTLSEELIATVDFSELNTLLERILPQFGFKSCYISLYGEKDSEDEQSQLIVAFNENGQIKIGSEDVFFNSRHLAPAGMLPEYRRYSMMVDTLFHGNEQLGFCVLEVGPQEGISYEIVRRRIRSAVKSALLLEEVALHSKVLTEINERLQKEIAERQRMEKQLITINNREQQWIGQNLHNGLGQLLSAISFMCKKLEGKLRSRHCQEADDANEILKLVNKSIEYSKECERLVLPSEVEENDISVALREFAGLIEKLYNISTRFTCEGTISIKEETLVLTIYRITQEAVLNAIKHAKPKNINIILAVRDRTLSLTIKDDGVGSNDNADYNIGLRIMEYRAHMVGGILQIKGDGKKGTTISFSCNLKS
jgi:sigma-B regulation protein RsbU (phosphoserine phosphatase)